MSKTIYKFHLNPGTNVVPMAKGATLLSVQMQNNLITVWALVDNPAAESMRHIMVLGTGWEVEDVESSTIIASRFLGTVQLMGGARVFHVFDIGEV